MIVERSRMGDMFDCRTRCAHACCVYKWVTGCVYTVSGMVYTRNCQWLFLRGYMGRTGHSGGRSVWIAQTAPLSPNAREYTSSPDNYDRHYTRPSDQQLLLFVRMHTAHTFAAFAHDTDELIHLISSSQL
jgi:hypothetical protein